MCIQTYADVRVIQPGGGREHLVQSHFGFRGRYAKRRGTDRKRQTPYDSASARTLKKAKLVKMESKMVVASGQGGGAGDRRDVQGFRLATSRSVQVPES